MAELPDDAIEAAIQAVRAAPDDTNFTIADVVAVAVRAAEPVIAARVPAEALSAVSGDEAAMSGLRNAIVLAALGGGRVGEAIDTFAVAVRARAVAGERQRIAQRLEAVLNTSDLFAADAAYVEAAWQLRSELLSTFAAGSVPVATPEPTARDERPHSRACGLRQHEHGSACAADCPTCRAGGGWHYPVATPEPDDSRIANRESRIRRRRAITTATTPPPVFGRTNSWCRGPVAVRLQPERVGFGTDAFEVGGSLPGQPVATPTEPAIPARLMSLEVPSDEEADERGVDGLLATFDVPAGNAWPAGEYSILAPASPVPAEQPSAAEQAMAARAEQALVQRVLDAHDDEFGTQHGVAYRVMVADHWRLIETFEPHRTGAAR